MRERPEHRFKHKLALATGRFVSEIDAYMSSSELVDWMAFDEMYPFGSDRDNLHAAIIASTVANCHSRRKVKPSEFMVKDEVQEREDNAKKFLTNIRAIARNNNSPA